MKTKQPHRLVKGNRCCCGHARKSHTFFKDGGHNGKGSRMVCLVPNCHQWLYCNLSERPAPVKKGVDK